MRQKNPVNLIYPLAAFLMVVLIGAGAATIIESRYGEVPQGFGVARTLALNLCVFWWFHQDRKMRAYRGSRMLSFYIVAFGAIALVFYLMRSRPPGERLRSLLRLLGFGLISFMVAAIGFLLGEFAKRWIV